jgi:hypothetical protein
MSRNILSCPLLLGLFLLAPAGVRGQSNPAPPPPEPILVPILPGLLIPQPTAAELGANGDNGPLFPTDEKDRPAAPPATSPTLANNSIGAFGQGGAFGLFDPRLLAIPSTSFATTWFPSERVGGQPTHLGYIQDDFFLSVPVYHDGGDTWAVSIRGRNETFFTQAVLPQSQRTFPTDLWALDFGTTVAHTFDNGWTAGGRLSVGSASDEPFHSTRELSLGASAFLRIPSGERNAWMFSLSYSPLSEVNFPIPMVSYLYNPSDYLRVNIGLPFQVMYRPTEDLTLNLSYMLLRTVHARATYRVCPLLRAHVGFDWGNESYFLADRQNINDRLFYYDMRASAGLLFNVTKSFTIDLSGGYVFNRFYFEGAQYADKNTNELNIGAGPYLSLQGRLRW